MSDASGALVYDGSDRYRPLPLQTPDRVRAKGKEVGNIASTDRASPLGASLAVQYNPPVLHQERKTVAFNED